ncbi:isoprenoid biosynthesis protein with amidotransferase-like domain [Vibrio cholerae]|uniref:Isoprenoid biosynthesis protein with amidotransferase-like domain n=2 Tax=Vibrio cholerae TaxID=666 RepID=A0A655XMJ4_VIBCL|nr:isoprenoid biosynthesis protein with amidotransferase-like domain [Vibrio cholerae]CSC15903.1 isoprenoid biosynthesis protein with amidotransferase-like domain [Vibrio cholerae]CSC56050.1 isoprenoid biosynthesis protein with amidotransferase-like domain [Vibrio cholerae]CSC58902.1 isoprenoid biosynthesis protein with amidotransferase-like domain [Vibrio cholerae]
MKGAQCSINPDVAAACLAFADAQKPAGYICIAPTIIPMIYGEAAQGTIGNDHGTAAAFNQLGGQHVDCPVEGIVFDERHKVLSTPAYMLAENISQAASGIEKLVERLLQLA